MRVLVLLSSVALLVATGAQATAVRRGALNGLVTRGPIAPICVVEQPCNEPAPDVTLLFSRNGRVVGRAVTDADGRYSVRLVAGLYSVRRPASSGIDRRLEPNRVRVFAGRAIRVDFSIDTGIR